MVMVSVIIPMYNASDTIIHTLESVRNQTFQDFEIIIVDDGCTDNSADLVFSFREQNEGLNIKILRQLNAGVSAARNTGIKAANGAWIALLDSDDEWLPHKLERQMEVVRSNQKVNFLATLRVGDGMGWFFKGRDNVRRVTTKQLLYKMFFITPTVIFRRSLVEKVGYFNEKQGYCEDGNFFIRCAKFDGSFLLNEELVITGGGKANFGDKGLSSNLWKMQKGEMQNILFAFHQKIINVCELLLILSISMLKYSRRVIIVCSRKL